MPHKDNIHNTQHPLRILETVKILDHHDRQGMSVSCVAIKAHFDYQCQFASDFLTRTQKAFQRSHYMHESQGDQEWSQGDDHNDHEQPFQ